MAKQAKRTGIPTVKPTELMTHEHWQDEAWVLPACSAGSSANKPTPKPFTKEDPLWGIVGMIDESGDAWVSGDKRRALAEVCKDRH